MSKNTTVAIVVIIILVIGGYFFFSGQQAVAPSTNENASPESAMPVPGTHTPETIVEKKSEVVVTYTYNNGGFSPSTVTIRVGDTVTFKNNNKSQDFWPASAMHPTHTLYPGSDIKKCGTSEENSIFDACRRIHAGGSWSFVFTQKGSWDYHDHLNPRNFGKVVVE